MDIRRPMRDSRPRHAGMGGRLANYLSTLSSIKVRQTKTWRNDESHLLETKKALKDYDLPVTVQAFSSLKKVGIGELTQQLDGWFNPTAKTMLNDEAAKEE